MDIAALAKAFDRFFTTLDAATVPAPEGGRRVDGIAQAIALSEATDALYIAIGQAIGSLFHDHGRTVTGLPPGYQLLESDTPDGPGTPIPLEHIKIETARVGGPGMDATLVAALDAASRVAAFPQAKWNAMQAARPGASHQRWHAGDIVTVEDLNVLGSAARLLRLVESNAQPMNDLVQRLLLSSDLPQLSDEEVARLRAFVIALQAAQPGAAPAISLSGGNASSGGRGGDLTLTGPFTISGINAADLPETRRLVRLLEVLAYNEAKRQQKPTDAADRVQTPPSPPVIEPSDAAQYTAVDLASEFGLPYGKLRKRLERWRATHALGTDWIENTEAGAGDAKYAYRFGAVKGVIKELRASIAASTKRPPKPRKEPKPPRNTAD
ncbi:hypothetical protein PHYC_02199 [Phycisphaerales bacterium]|nr:hypothetical protein PHYC_02199 [Phycisphaerales bacterium]